jgi:hypothetical protein
MASPLKQLIHKPVLPRRQFEVLFDRDERDRGHALTLHPFTFPFHAAPNNGLF